MACTGSCETGCCAKLPMLKSERDAELRLDDILQAIERIRSYVSGADFARFEGEAMLFDAVSMNVLVIGESIGRLPDRLKDRLGALPWRSMVAVRNLVAHGYPELDAKIVWDIATTRLDALEAVIAPMLAEVRNP
ncbi:DUF86 domain-containing protein [Caulobacter vibrioides]|uniref:DUF86 domain-containing protein n=1 Tax=Caulobacter vibrioides TaxID=155892 RepID=A0A290MZ52_CAUVI|nr:DUF86 domain-containing protein [Caulobacter vibrioides]ATC34279.1 DUF86 domain-containing protein [Caulobacter vibrioides]